MSNRYLGRVLSDVHVPGRGMIWLDDVVCEDSCHIPLSQCSHSDWGVNDCSHHEDVYIACYDRTRLTTRATHQTTTVALGTITADNDSNLTRKPQQ